MTKDLKTVKVNFNLRTAANTNKITDYKTDNEKDTAINCIVRWNNQKLILSNVEKVKPKYWNKEKQRANDVKSFIGRSEFNTRLEGIESRIQKVYRLFLTEQNRYPSVEELREVIKHELAGTKPIEEVATLYSHIDDFIKRADSRHNQRTQKKLSSTTVQVYKQVYAVLKEYAGSKALDFKDIDFKFYDEYKTFLTDIKQYKYNTIGKHIKTLKSFLNDAGSRGIEVKQDYKHSYFMGGYEDVENVYLNEDELKEIAELDLKDKPTLDRVRDLFIVGCYTGLRFSDFTTIPAKSINRQTNKIKITTQKTAQEIIIPIHARVNAILDKYKDMTENSLPPALSNARMNLYLKDVAKLAQINEKVSKTQTIAGRRVTKTQPKHELVCTHTARRSLATNSYLAGVPIYAIMKLTGHSSEKTFRNYLKVTNDEHADIISAIWNRNELKVAK
jgi:site-specific recombinase XerD